MKSVALFALFLLASCAANGQVKTSEAVRYWQEPHLSQRPELANIMCNPARPDGTVICHIVALHPDTDGDFECRLDERCHRGYVSALGRGQSCFGALVCKPAAPDE